MGRDAVPRAGGRLRVGVSEARVRRDGGSKAARRGSGCSLTRPLDRPCWTGVDRTGDRDCSLNRTPLSSIIDLGDRKIESSAVLRVGMSRDRAGGGGSQVVLLVRAERPIVGRGWRCGEIAANLCNTFIAVASAG
jgi:hypothetical protein